MSNSPEQQIQCNDLKINSSRRVQVRDNTVERHDIEEGEYVDVFVINPKGEDFGMTERKVQSRHRIQIPEKYMENHGLETGDWVDIIIAR